jgi:hypothetical protein
MIYPELKPMGIKLDADQAHTSTSCEAVPSRRMKVTAGRNGTISRSEERHTRNNDLENHENSITVSPADSIQPTAKNESIEQGKQAKCIQAKTINEANRQKQKGRSSSNNQDTGTQAQTNTMAKMHGAKKTTKTTMYGETANDIARKYTRVEEMLTTDPKMAFGLLGYLNKQAMQIIHTFEPEHVCAVLGVYAGLKIEVPQPLMAAIGQRVDQVKANFNASGVMHCMCSLVTVCQGPNTVISSLGHRACELLSELTAHDVTRILFFLAKRRTMADQRVVEVFFRRAEDFAECMHAPEDIARMLWSCAKLDKQPDKKTLDGLCKRINADIGSFRPLTIARVLWSLAKLGRHPGDVVYTALCQHACDTAHMFKPRSLTELLWAWATLRQYPGDSTFHAICQRACVVISDVKPKHLCRILWACAVLAQDPGKEIFDQFMNQSVKQMSNMKPKQVPMLLWSCAVLGYITEGIELFNLAQKTKSCALDSKLGLKDFKSRTLNQLQQFTLSVELESCADAGIKHDNSTVASNASAQARQYMRCMHLKSLANAGLQQRTFHVSTLQRQVTNAIERLGLRFQTEAIDSKSGYSIDVLVDGRIAVEVDGPCHFLRLGRTPTGSTLLKRRHLTLLNYTVISVPYWDWQALAKRCADRDAYMRDLLNNSSRKDNKVLRNLRVHKVGEGSCTADPQSVHGPAVDTIYNSDSESTAACSVPQPFDSVKASRLARVLDDMLSTENVRVRAEDLSTATMHVADDLSTATMHVAEDLSTATMHVAEDLSTATMHGHVCAWSNNTKNSDQEGKKLNGTQSWFSSLQARIFRGLQLMACFGSPG